MQSETHLHRCGDIECHPLTTIQAERLRIAADMNIRKEARRANPKLRRTLVHVLVLDSLDALQYTQLQQPLPTFSETAQMRHDSTSCIDFSSPVPDLDDDVGLEADDETDSSESSSDEELTFDDEFDTEHSLSRSPSHPRNLNQHSRNDKSLESAMSRGTVVLDSNHWTKPALGGTDDRDSDSLVVASVVEVEGWDD